jgi:hypothetical protein
MGDPVPAVTEAAATGETAAIFADIRQVLGVEVVNLIWRHLATIDGALPWAWGTLRPLYTDGSVTSEAAALHASLALPASPRIPGDVFTTLGLRPDDMTAIRKVLAAYDHTNAMALVAFLALRARLDGYSPGNAEIAHPEAVATSRIGLPRLLTLTEMQPATARLVGALNGLGTRRPGAVLASMYRHLAHWPPYLSFAWLLLAPLDEDGRLASAIEGVHGAARTRAERLLPRLGRSMAPMPRALVPAISAAIAPFVDDVLAKMVLICAFLRHATDTAMVHNDE